MNGFYKGFTEKHLESSFGIRFESETVVVPYYGIDGTPYREKTFTTTGKAIGWSGVSRPQIPYGLETLKKPGTTVFLVEGESCGWTVRAEFPETPVLGIPGALSWRPEWARLLDRFQFVYASFDGDDAGRCLTDAVMRTVPGTRWVKLPDALDTRDLIQLHGGMDAFEALIADADHYAECTTQIFLANAEQQKALRIQKTEHQGDLHA